MLIKLVIKFKFKIKNKKKEEFQMAKAKFERTKPHVNIGQVSIAPGKIVA